ncbi:hypothetical protein T261_6197 [Streptomyces lydicus]|nr:hypothetical protein T261_6197 [Streptomyces lydicus]
MPPGDGQLRGLAAPCFVPVGERAAIGPPERHLPGTRRQTGKEGDRTAGRTGIFARPGRGRRRGARRRRRPRLPPPRHAVLSSRRSTALSYRRALAPRTPRHLPVRPRPARIQAPDLRVYDRAWRASPAAVPAPPVPRRLHARCRRADEGVVLRADAPCRREAHNSPLPRDEPTAAGCTPPTLPETDGNTRH